MNCGNEIVVWFYFKTLSKLDIETWYLIITAPNDIMSLVIKKKCTVRMRTNQFCVVVVALQKLTMLRHRCINVDANGDRITSFFDSWKSLIFLNLQHQLGIFEKWIHISVCSFCCDNYLLRGKKFHNIIIVRHLQAIMVLWLLSVTHILTICHPQPIMPKESY